MATSSSAKDSQKNTENQIDEYEWIGDAITDFHITSEQLEQAYNLREEWRREIETEKWSSEDWQALKISPEAQDARNNSKASGDQNILHYDSEVVEEFAEEYSNFVREPQQDEDVVINQGMTMIDALTEEIDRPLESLEGKWTEMVYASEAGKNPDKVILSNNTGDRSYHGSVFPEGENSKAASAAEISPEFAENPGDYHPKHNEYLTLLQSQAVGRSFNTDYDVRNGELLIENQITANKPLDWDRIQAIDFNLEEVHDGEKPQVTAEWSVDIQYEDEIVENALEYQETSMYAEGFEDMSTIEEEYQKSSNMFAPFTASAKANAELTKATMQNLKKINPWLNS